MKKDIFDEIIEHLKELQVKEKTTFIAPEIVNEFFTDVQQPAGSQKMPRVEARGQFENIRQKPEFSVAPEPAPAPAKPVFSAPADNPAISNMNFEELNSVCLQCRICPLCQTRTNVVFGEGNPNADLMFVGEGPGYDEDQQGRPFVGKAGELLTKMINAMQFSRQDVYIANIVKCRPPKNRNPLPEEAAACIPYLKRQIELIKPKVIVVLGAVPLKYLLDKTGITRQRGQWDSYNNIQVMPTFHPAYLLRNPEAKRETWSDLQMVMKVFGKVHKR
jgi:DNA polymerase